MKFSKKLRAMVAAIAMLTLSAASAVTGTVAWFTANNLVNVSGMNIQAEVENGIVIANQDHDPKTDADWLTTVTATYGGAGATYVPTSTNTLTAWYHGLSDQANNGQSNVNYDTFGTPTVTNGVATATTSNHFTTAKNIYLVNEFYIQASAKVAIPNQDLFIEQIEISGVSGSAELDKSIRVGLMIDGTMKGIYAPVSGATLSHKVNGVGPSTVAIDVSAANDKNKVLEDVSIPAYTAAGTSALACKVFVYFEGEDVAHKSANITNSLDTLALSLKFSNANHTNA